MAKGPIITNEIKNLITQVFLDNPEWRAKEIQQEVSRRVNKNGDDWPSLSVVEKLLVEVRKRYRDTQEDILDTPWHIGLMDKYNVDPAAISYILLVQNYAESNPDIFKQPHEPLSVRQALWVARLYGTVNSDLIKKKKDKITWSIGYYLYQWSEAYAMREKICELSGVPFDTRGLDEMLRNKAEVVTVKDTTLGIYRHDKSFDIDTIDENLIKQMEKMNKGGE